MKEVAFKNLGLLDEDAETDKTQTAAQKQAEFVNRMATAKGTASYQRRQEEEFMTSVKKSFINKLPRS